MVTEEEAVRRVAEGVHDRRCVAPHRTPEAYERCVEGYVAAVRDTLAAVERSTGPEVTTHDS